jgi:hypothetical protein
VAVASGETGLTASLEAELGRLGERFEKQARYIEVIERKLRDMLEGAGVASVTVTLADPLVPLNGGVSLSTEAEDGERPYQTFGPVASPPATDGDWWPRPEAALRPLLPNAGWRNYALRGRAAKVVGVSVCGLPPAILESTVAAIAAQQDLLRDFIPLFLTDSADFDVFRRHGFVWEYFPCAAERARYGGATGWAAYAASRRSLLQRKWGLDDVVCIGPAEFGRIGLQGDAEARTELIAAPLGEPADLATGGSADAEAAAMGAASPAPNGSGGAESRSSNRAGARYRLPRRKRVPPRPRMS